MKGKGSSMNKILSLVTIRMSKLILLTITTAAGLGLYGCSSNEIAEGKEFFTQKGCIQCHSNSTLGIVSPTNKGPDLAFAYEDVQKRFGTSLENFLKNPTGTMQTVLTTQIKLTDQEKEKAVRLLKYSYDNRPKS